MLKFSVAFKKVSEFLDYNSLVKYPATVLLYNPFHKYVS